ncbi:MAG: response regulator [Cyclobacteriaceae bacterium]
MSKRMKFLWIDDEPLRKRAADNLEEALNVDVSFIGLEGKDIDNVLHDLLTKDSEPNLIVMDHVLNKASSETFKKGSTAATVIHEKWPECPIVAITAVDLRNDIDSRQRSAYENMFRDNKISEHYQTIESIALGFNMLKKKRPVNQDEILDRLVCPKLDRERLKKILPIEIKEEVNIKDASFIIEIYKWLNTTLFSRPGFLYDKLWAATYLGLSEKGFDSVKKLFEPAKYMGVFSDPSNERWWKSQLTEIVAEKTGKVDFPWITGRYLVEPKKLNYSKSHPTKKEYPQTVAALDESIDTKWVPMRLEETEAHPQFEDMLFFEQLRVMK